MAASPSDTLRIGLVGCGMISEFQTRAIGQLPNAEVAGYFDAVPERAEARAKEFDAAFYPEYEKMLADPDVHAISICTPSGVHLEPAVEAARAGKHVMVEKPVEVTAERCDEIIRACQEAGVTLGAIFPRRFLESSLALKSAVDDGRFDTLVHADVTIKWFRSQEYYDQGGWRGTWKLDGGGALMNQGIHGIDMLQWLMGGIQSVAAFTDTLAHTGIEVEDVASAAVRFHNGALGNIAGTTGAWPGTKIRIEICGTGGHVVLEDEVIHVWNFREEREEDARILAELGPREGLSGGGAADPRAIDFEGHRRNFEDFVNAILSGGVPFVNGAEGRHAVAAITSIYRSARERAFVDVT